MKGVFGHPLATYAFGSSHRPGPSGPGGGSGKGERDVNLGKMARLVGIFDVVGRKVIDLKGLRKKK